jgi:hypothetical protein
MLATIQFSPLSSHHFSKNLKIKISRTTISSVFYGCEAWCLTLRDESSLRIFDNRVLKRIFGPKREEVAGGWTRLHNEELHSLYASPSIIRAIKSRRMRWAWNLAHTGKMKNAYKILVGKPEGKRPLRKLGRRYEDNIKKNLRGNRVEKSGLDTSDSGYGPVADPCEHGSEPLSFMKDGEFLD